MRLLIAAAVLASLLGQIRPAVAAFPGRNGPIVFTRRGEIAVMRADGTKRRTLTHLHGHAEAPSVSANGRWIVFDAWRGGSFQIFKIRVNGRGLRQLTTNGVYDWAPSWSPDGRTIAWTYRAGNDGQIWAMRANGTHKRKLVGGGNNEWVRYAPNGRHIAFGSDRSGQYDVYIARANGTALQRLTQAPSLEDFPEWSPDGTRISFLTDFFAGQQARATPALRGTQAPSHWAQLVPNSVTDVVYNAAWAPDGRFACYSDGTAIWRVNLATGRLVWLAKQNGYGVAWGSAPKR
jgi:Tol biopolymer transport system component